MEFKYLTGQIFDFSTRKLTDMALWACDELAIKPAEMYERTKEDFVSAEDDKNLAGQLAQMRLEHFEKRRRTKMRVLVDFMKDHGKLYVPPEPKEAKQDINDQLGLSAVKKAPTMRPKSARHDRSRTQQNLGKVGGQMGFAVSMTARVHNPRIQRNQAYLRAEMDKDEKKLEKLLRVKGNIENNARTNVEEIDKIMKRTESKQKAAKDMKFQNKLLLIKNKKDTDGRRNAAADKRRKVANDHERKSMTVWRSNQRDVVRRSEAKAKRDKLISARNFMQTTGHCPADIDEDDLFFHGKSPSPTAAMAQTQKTEGMFERDETPGMMQAPSANKLNDDTRSAMSGRMAKTGISCLSVGRQVRPYSSNPYTRKQNLENQQEKYIQTALSDYEDRMVYASELRRNHILSKSMNCRDSWAKATEVCQRKKAQAESCHLKKLQEYIDNGLAYQKKQAELKQEEYEQKEFNREEKNEEQQKIKTNLAKLDKQHEVRRKAIIRRQRDAEKNIKLTQDQQDLHQQRKKEYLALKRLEIFENNAIEKRLRFATKKQLILKQIQLNESHTTMTNFKHQILQQRTMADIQRQELMKEQRHQVKFIKENYLNQQEKLAKKRATKEAMLAKQMAQELADEIEYGGTGN